MQSNPFFISPMWIRKFMQAFFYLLYHPFAFGYDLVAAFVSFGEWKNWGRSIVPLIKGTHILELGHGPGHLQRFLFDLKFDPVAIDESVQMGKLAKRRIGPPHKLTRGLAQALPYRSESFDSVISTFPSEYIFDPRTLAEIKRVLAPGGRLVILPTVFPSNRCLKWLYRITGESPQTLDDTLKKRLAAPFTQAGFLANVQIQDAKFSRLVILIAQA